MRKFESSQTDESKFQSADSSKAYRRASRAGFTNLYVNLRATSWVSINAKGY